MLNKLKHIWKAAGRDYIYVMWSWRLFWCVKIGVSNSPKLRRNQVNDSIAKKKGFDPQLTVLAAPLLFWAYTGESVLHNCKPLRYLKYSGNMETDGGTEWFWTNSPIFTVFFIIGCYAFDVSMFQWSVVFILPCLPLDAILLTFLFFIIQWAIVFFAVWIGWMGLNFVF